VTAEVTESQIGQLREQLTPLRVVYGPLGVEGDDYRHTRAEKVLQLGSFLLLKALGVEPDDSVG